MKTKKWIAVLLCLIMVMSLCACSTESKMNQSQSNVNNANEEDGEKLTTENEQLEDLSQDYEVVDMAGRTVTIPADADSFACIGPGCLRLYCYVADEANLAGVEEVEVSWGDDGRTYRMAIENIDSYAIVGPGGPGNAPDAEMLYSAAPDVIFTCYGMEPAEIDELQERIRIPVVKLSYGEASLFSEEVNESLRLIGTITGNSDRAEEVIAYLDEARADLQGRTSGVTEKPSAYLGCQSSRGSHGIESTTGDYPMFDVLNAENVVATAGIHEYVMLDKEQLLDMNPDVIVIDAGGLSILQEDYAANPDFYNSLTAVKNGQMFLQMPFNYYATNIDIALADAYYIGTVLYPEQFADIDPVEKFNEITMYLLGIEAYDRIAASYYGGFQNVVLGE